MNELATSVVPRSIGRVATARMPTIAYFTLCCEWMPLTRLSSTSDTNRCLLGRLTTRDITCGLLLHSTQVAWSVCMCVCLLVTSVSPCPANMVEPIVIEMPFGVWTLGVQLTMY